MGLYSVFLGVGQIVGSLIGGYAAEWRGIDPSRLLFAGRLPPDECDPGSKHDPGHDEAAARGYRGIAGIDVAFPEDGPPRVPHHKLVCYELHVRGHTRLHPEVPEPFRGTYQGLPLSRNETAETSPQLRVVRALL